jgi:7-cyano-7-deazaguanine synthase in queuosine biosynthesis
VSRIFVRTNPGETDTCDLVFHTGKNLITGELSFKREFGELTSLERDLLLIASSVFAADRCVKRGDREDFTRVIEVHIPIVNAGLLQPFTRSIEEVLRKLSNDSWRIVLRQIQGEIERPFRVTETNGQTLLFSGGLDSFAAAFEFGAPKDSSLHLVSHITHNSRTTSAQNTLVSLLKKRGISLPHRQFYVSSRPRDPTPALEHDIENTQRTRSFLFLVLAALSARRVGHREVLMMAENGQMAIHLPLTQGRIGAFSTHTAHPDVLRNMESILNGVFDKGIKINNPYVNRTKAEVVKILCDNIPESLAATTSCWKNTRLPRGASHCGACIPCYVRRIAIEAHVRKDPTKYARNPWIECLRELPANDDARRNIFDYVEFISTFRAMAAADLMAEWPELHSPNIDAGATIAMYKRAAAEAAVVLGRYPTVASFLA